MTVIANRCSKFLAWTLLAATDAIRHRQGPPLALCRVRLRSTSPRYKQASRSSRSAGSLFEPAFDHMEDPLELACDIARGGTVPRMEPDESVSTQEPSTPPEDLVPILLSDSRHADYVPTSTSPPPVIRSTPQEISRPPGRIYSLDLFKVTVYLEVNTNVKNRLPEPAVHMSIPKHRNILRLYYVESVDPEATLFVVSNTATIPLSLFLDRGDDYYPPHYVKNVRFPFKRTRLIAFMFTQMCRGVAACHDASVYHCNIRPKSFVVSREYAGRVNGQWTKGLRKVRLTEFGFATTNPDVSLELNGPHDDVLSRLTATCKPRTADVWSLGVILINMLYHRNPWDDDDDADLSFRQYLRIPEWLIVKLLYLPHMTMPLASFLARRVFCVLDNPEEQITAQEFATWAEDLPNLIGESDPLMNNVTPGKQSPGLTHILAVLSDTPLPAASKSEIPSDNNDRTLMQSGYSSPKQRPRVPATRRHRLPQVDVGLFAEGRDTPIRPASRQTILSVQKSVFSQYSSKSRKNFHHTSPGQPMLR